MRIGIEGCLHTACFSRSERACSGSWSGKASALPLLVQRTSGIRKEHQEK